jgi:hypothetical protein
LRHYATKAGITEPQGESISLVKHILINQKNKNCINNKLIHLIADPQTLTLAYELIKSNPGNMTKGGVNETQKKRAKLKQLSNTSFKLASLVR